MAVNPAVQTRGIERYVIVCGHRDEPKGAMLRSVGLAIERYWFTAALRTEDASPISDKVRKVVSIDLPRMAALTGEKQRDYPEIARDNALVLVYAEAEIIQGYAHSLLVSAPAVYDPGGLSCIGLVRGKAEDCVQRSPYGMIKVIFRRTQPS